MTAKSKKIKIHAMLVRLQELEVEKQSKSFNKSTYNITPSYSFEEKKFFVEERKSGRERRRARRKLERKNKK